MRDHFGAPVAINSGIRCEEWNRVQGGSPRSQHLLGTAADIAVKGVDPKEVADWLTAQGLLGGIGRYKTFTHLDTRGKKARWGRN